MNKKVRFLLFLLVAMAGFMVSGMNVYAEEGDNVSKKIKFYFNVYDWKNNNDLTFACGTATGNGQTIAPHIYYGEYDGENVGTLTEVNNCEFTLSTLGWEANTDYRIIEEFDFTDFHGVGPEYGDISVTPGKVTSNTFTADDLVFANYNPTDSETAVVYSVNQTNDDGTIVPGGLHVYQAWIQAEDDSKETEKSFGAIYIPSYCVKMSFSARGNIASSYGTFVFDVLGDSANHITSPVTGGDVEPVTMCTLSGNPIGLGDINEILNTDPASGDIVYSDVNHSDEYEFVFIDNGDEREGNIIYRNIEVAAYLESELSQTGLVYRIIPFIVLIGLMVSGYIVIRKNKIKE